jgi:hypothetical protein
MNYEQLNLPNILPICNTSKGSLAVVNENLIQWQVNGEAARLLVTSRF